MNKIDEKGYSQQNAISIAEVRRDVTYIVEQIGDIKKDFRDLKKDLKDSIKVALGDIKREFEFHPSKDTVNSNTRRIEVIEDAMTWMIRTVIGSVIVTAITILTAAAGFLYSTGNI